MYSADEPLVATASQKASKEVSSFEMSKAFANPTPSPAIPLSSESSSPISTEPSLQLVSTSPTAQETEDMDVHFGFNLWVLSNQAKDQIKTKVEAQGGEWTGTLHIDGHTDAQGPDTYNRVLGLKRAEAVKTYLVSLGIPEDRIQVQSFGKDGAVCQEQTPDCFEHNRRAHVAFLSEPSHQQDDSLLSMTSDAREDSTAEVTPPIVDSASIEESQDEIALQEEIPGELVAVDQFAPAKSLP